MTRWMQRAIERQKHARAPGTIKNTMYTVKEYILFTYFHQFNPLCPQTLQLCAFIEMLLDRDISPATVQNKLSQVRTWIRSCQGSLQLIHEETLSKYMDSIIRTSTHVPKPKEPLPIGILKQVLSLIPDTPIGWVSRAALLCLIYGGFRQTEILPPSKGKFNRWRHLTRSDVIVTESNIQLTIKYGKNLVKPEQRRIHVFKRSTNPQMCVVKAVNMVLALTPTQDINQAMFVFPHDGNPVPVTHLRKVLSDNLKILKQDTSRYTLHSLRKTLVSCSYHWGIPVQEIKDFGAWNSQAYQAYLKTSADININNAMTSMLS